MKIKIDEIIQHYRGKIKLFGSTPQGMDWKNEESQYIRFEMIARYIDFSKNPSVLDVGCGNGEFLNFCLKNNYTLNYKGLDVTPEMVELTNNRFGNDKAELGEFLTWKPKLKFDYVIASGTFNGKFKMGEELWHNYFYENIKRMYEHAGVRVIFNCMSCYVDYRYDWLYYATPDQLSEFAVKYLSRNFIIDNSYPLYEMTMVIDKHP
jgi:cyclopropane fatty-acyl-phospholipid synthase-like methyltransferase